MITDLPSDLPQTPTAYLTVSALNAAVADTLAVQFGQCRVRGEVMGIKRASSGHVYFALKDATASANCVLYRARATLYDRLPREGETIEVRCIVGLYAPRGDYQLRIEGWQTVENTVGARYEQFIRIKAQLQAEGLLDEAGKRPLPAALGQFVRTVGVVTSPQAAALQDVLSALARRAPHIHVVLYPAAVQGDAAAAQLCEAVETASLRSAIDKLDVLLVVRGGGSMDDLWAFNDIALARAIAACAVPVIAGVGHETDFTIADFVADMRAPTPTAAAELAALPTTAWQGRLMQIDAALHTVIEDKFAHAGQRLDYAARGLAYAHPAAKLARLRLQVHACGQRLQALSPYAVLARGYALVEDATERVVESAQRSQSVGDGAVKIRWADGVRGARLL